MRTDTKSLLTGLLENINNAKAEKIYVYKVEGFVSYADYVIILTSLSTSHVKSLLVKTEEYFKTKKVAPFIHTRKHDNYQWVVLDYGSIIIHYFQNQEREFYRLDLFFQKLLPSNKWFEFPKKLSNEPSI